MSHGSFGGPDKALWALCVVAVGVSFLLTPATLPSLELCWFKTLFHYPCPACGLTHSFLAIGHGHWEDAWAYNPFGFAWYPLALYGALHPLLQKAAPRPIRGLDRTLGLPFFFPALVVAMVLFWLWRFFH